MKSNEMQRPNSSLTAAESSKKRELKKRRKMQALVKVSFCQIIKCFHTCIRQIYGRLLLNLILLCRAKNHHYFTFASNAL